MTSLFFLFLLCHLFLIKSMFVYNSQHAASATTDAAIMAKLKATANPRDAQRLNRLDSPHANAWLSARPSCMDGTDTVLPQNLPHSRCPSPRPTRVIFFCPVPSLRANHGPHWGITPYAARSPATELRGTIA